MHLYQDSQNCMTPWASKGNDLELRTYPDKANLSLAGVEGRVFTQHVNLGQ